MKKLVCLIFCLFAVTAIAAIPATHWLSFSTNSDSPTSTWYVRLASDNGDSATDYKAQISELSGGIDHDATTNFVANEHLPGIDEDDMTSDSAVHVPTQQSVKAYADTKQAGDADLTTIAAADNGAVLAATTASFLTTDETKLDNIEALADVTDAANVDAAGAVMNTDATTAAMSFVIDEDSFATNSATKVPSQQSVKAYVDASGGGGTVQGTDDTHDIQAANEGTLAGNVRGAYSVDLQTVRSAATQIASSYASSIGGGQNNTSSGPSSRVGGGDTNVASGVYASVSGGSNNTASGDSSRIGGGDFNESTANYTHVSGGLYAKASLYGQFASASGRFTAAGDAQTSVLTARNSTTDATPSELFLNGSSSRCTIPSDRTVLFTITVVARRTDADNESAGYEFKGVIDNNAGSTALVVSVTTTVLAEDTAAWDCTISADDTNDSLKIEVTGEAAKTIRWVARIELTEVSG